MFDWKLFATTIFFKFPAIFSRNLSTDGNGIFHTDTVGTRTWHYSGLSQSKTEVRTVKTGPGTAPTVNQLWWKEYSGLFIPWKILCLLNMVQDNIYFSEGLFNHMILGLLFILVLRFLTENASYGGLSSFSCRCFTIKSPSKVPA